MHKNNIILGAGSHALETFRVYLQTNTDETFAGFYEDKTLSNIDELEGYKVKDINSILADPKAKEQFKIVTAIGSLARISMIRKLEDAGFEFYNIFAKGIELQKDFKCGTDVYIAQGAVITANVHLGSHVIVNVKTSISHDVTIGNNVIISPGVTICGKVKIGNNVFIGAGATVIDEINIGDNCLIAAGACVTKSVESNTQVGGVPAKFMKNR